jgi:hypothetical protein
MQMIQHELLLLLLLLKHCRVLLLVLHHCDGRHLLLLLLLQMLLLHQGPTWILVGVLRRIQTVRCCHGNTVLLWILYRMNSVQWHRTNNW